MSAVVLRVVNSNTGALKRDRTNHSVGYATDRRRPWNKCRLNQCREYMSSFNTHLSHSRPWLDMHKMSNSIYIEKAEPRIDPAWGPRAAWAVDAQVWSKKLKALFVYGYS